jgi:two-component system alkaline phosphatase synthesis response regulator PhoP
MTEKILVVDDEAHIVKLCQVNLERAGYQVITASNGQEALEKIEIEKPDLVILDLAMPHKSGVRVIEELVITKKIILPILVLTAKDIERQVAHTIALLKIC